MLSERETLRVTYASSAGGVANCVIIGTKEYHLAAKIVDSGVTHWVQIQPLTGHRDLSTTFRKDGER